jgi:hypothetical protein
MERDLRVYAKAMAEKLKLASLFLFFFLTLAGSGSCRHQEPDAATALLWLRYGAADRDAELEAVSSFISFL